MTAHQFRRMALSLPAVEERMHMDHPDFRVGGRIFATLGYPDEGWGMVKLSPEDQRALVQSNPAALKPANGAWGRQGSTLVRLKVADGGTVNQALTTAWMAKAPKKIVAQHRRRSSLFDDLKISGADR
jgi:hypothetical protein